MKISWGTCLAALLTLVPPEGLAEGRALLIGVGEYMGHPELSLDGPRYDAEKLAAELKAWGFGDIEVLVDAKATGAAIRKALKALAARTRPGDQVFVFFSGHGTSAFDPKWAKVCADVESGCLIPHDVENGDEATILRSLILGRRDIRPALLDMEKQNPDGIFVAFDACYAQNSAKSVQGSAKLAKEAPLSAFIKKGAAKGSALDSLEDLDPTAYARPNESGGNRDSGFPYERVITLSASAKDERAFDIPEWKLKEQPTFDGKPHGRFTNAMLIGLRGAADLDRDQTISYRELHQFTIQQLRGGQSPQIQAKSAAMLESPAFGSNRKFERAGGSGPKARSTVGVLVRDGAAELREKIAEMKASGIELVDSAPDFIIEPAAGGWSLALDNGLEVRRYAREDLPSLLARLKAEPGVRKLMNWKFDKPAAKVELSFGPEGKGVHFIDDLVEFRMSASKAMYFLLVNVNTAGGISVIYPSKYQPSAKIEKLMSKARLEDPAGAEYMKLFAFETSPGDLNRFVTDDPFPAASAAFTELLSTIEKSSNGAEAGLVFYSARKPVQ